MNPIIYHSGAFLLIILATLVVGYIANKLLTSLVQKSTEGMTKDPTNYKFIKHVILACIYLIGFAIAVNAIPNLRALAG